MTTLPPPKTIYFSSDTLEKKVYDIVESFKDYIPITNDRYRLAYCLFKYLKGEGDIPFLSVKNNKLKLNGISEVELANKLEAELRKITNLS